MKYYQKPKLWTETYGITYFRCCDIYNYCTLYIINGKGLCVIQQRFNSTTKHTWWDSIDPWLANDIYMNKNFQTYFNEHATPISEPLKLPTFTVRQVMRALHMPPLKKEPWETRF